MLIRNIEVRELAPHDPETGIAQGIVAFLTDDSTIHVTCKSNFLTRSADGLRKRLIYDGVRQLRRMPEFRTGQRNFSFAPGIV